ncbi:Thioredoxin [Golovinomyces cichoracearum]|uniref:Thioredoxin n=1 Tax=Golovinomyces cichoracearum TaxID=62708 RepID=A0A420J5N1_9PEZI|nr:Thioredoxin [Golovinomyces cichoracearum]
MSIIHIGSSAQFSRILSSSKVVVADFYADWCGPCRAIAPFYESLATKHSKANRLTFTKIDVDNHQDIAQRYSVRSMPTFMIFSSGSVIKTISGADKSGLRSAIESAVQLAGTFGPVYSSEGRTLGSTDNKKTQITKSLDLRSIFNTILKFVALYFTTLFSLDAYGAGERSPFNINKTNEGPTSSGEKKNTRMVNGVGKKLGTMADL